MSLSCLDNLIGVRGDCESTSPLLDLYLNDLPYVTLENANAVIEGDENSGYQLLNKVIERSRGLLVNDIYRNLSPKFNYNSVISNSTVGYYQDTYRQIAGDGKIKGIAVEINEHPHLEFFLSTIRLFVNQTTTLNVLIYDLMTGELLYTIPVNTQASRIVSEDVFIQIPNLRQRQRIFIGYDSTGITSYETYIHENYVGCNSCGGTYYRNAFAYFRNGALVSGDPAVYNNLKNANDTGGLSIDYSINCSLTKVLCGIRNNLGYPLLYRSAMEFFLELMMTKRYNDTTVRLETITEAQAYYEAEYQKSLDNLIQNINLPNDKCFKCNSSINIVTTVP